MVNSHFFSPTNNYQTEKSKTDLVKQDQGTTGSLNNKLTEKNSFILNMQDRSSKVKEICSRFHKTFNGRLIQFFPIQ